MNTSESCRIFLCYRDSGSETAKLFADNCKNNNDINCGKVWYSDYEGYGNYVLDIACLLSQAEYAILFISNDFTKGFYGLTALQTLHLLTVTNEILLRFKR